MRSSTRVKILAFIGISSLITMFLLKIYYNQKQIDIKNQELIYEQYKEIQNKIEENLKLQQLSGALRVTIHQLVKERNIYQAEKLAKQQTTNIKEQTIALKSETVLCDDIVPGSKFILSYSLFGKEAEHYGRFIKDVAEEAQSLETYKEFTLRIYVDENFSESSRKVFKANHTNVHFCDVQNIPEVGDISKSIGTIWRFIPIGDLSIDVMCSRDLDTPLLQRGGDAVKEWLSSDKLFHVMRDRVMHDTVIMGGLWCFRVKKNPSLSKAMLTSIIEASKSFTLTTGDQVILAQYLWPKVKHDAMQHDAYLCQTYPGSQPFPTKRNDYFVGCVRDCWVFSKDKCPIECRPINHKDWEYC